MKITIQEMESAINFWRLKSPAKGEECALSSEVNSLATEYAMMIFDHRNTVNIENISTDAQKLIHQWKNTVSVGGVFLPEIT